MAQSTEDAAVLLADFVASLDNLPSEIHHILQEIGHKESRGFDFRNRANTRDGSIQKHARPQSMGGQGLLVPNPKEDGSVQKARADFEKAEQCAREKVALSERGVNLLSRHLNRLANQLELLTPGNVPDLPELPSFTPVLAPPTPQPAASSSLFNPSAGSGNSAAAAAAAQQFQQQYAASTMGMGTAATSHALGGQPQFSSYTTPSASDKRKSSTPQVGTPPVQVPLLPAQIQAQHFHAQTPNGMQYNAAGTPLASAAARQQQQQFENAQRVHHQQQQQQQHVQQMFRAQQLQQQQQAQQAQVAQAAQQQAVAQAAAQQAAQQAATVQASGGSGHHKRKRAEEAEEEGAEAEEGADAEDTTPYCICQRPSFGEHGVQRSRVPTVPDSAEVERAKREKEDKKIAEYKGLLDALYAKRDAQDYSLEALELSTKVLGLNPEFQTGWSIRRRILAKGILVDLDLETTQKTLEADLYLTNQSLKQNPKNYSVWEHRKWVLDAMPEADWNMEMMLVEAYLQKDGRNFHSWDYRRHIVAAVQALSTTTDLSTRTKPLKVPTVASELAFSKKKISENFSNFSAWHYRTKLLPKLWEEKGWKEGSLERVKQVDEEFDLVKQAYWSDPNDQSAWLYHRWLVGKGSVDLVRREIGGIEELLEEEPDSRWCLDSLVFYKRMLITLLVGEEHREEREQLVLECVEMLSKLETADPTRKMRYQDLKYTLLPRMR